MQDFRGEPNWLDGTVTDQPGPVSYKGLVREQLWKRRVDQMHQKFLSNKESKPEISVTHSNDTTDIQLVKPPQAETAEKSTLKPNETKSSENDNDEDAHAAATVLSFLLGAGIKPNPPSNKSAILFCLGKVFPRLVS